MAHHEEFVDPPVIPVDKKKIRKIWFTALILAVVTGIEFIIAFSGAGAGFKAFTFIALTIVKAFFIVAEFMHLGHEKRGLVLSILLPTAFLMWAILAFLIEADEIYQAIGNLWNYY